ncbi:MAG TPA: orotate phosphoribosyltransferase [Candidatus Thermoplasmatota archaeon]|nr:orotate phosphoribosyltransferase [Candidatus Thermoplasmatota archaeon]
MASIADSLLACGAVKFGDFTLTSGAKSPYYVDVKAASTDPATLKVIAHKMAQLAARNGPFDAVAGMELGAVPLATAVSLEANLPLLIIRKGERKHGTGKRIEGRATKGLNVFVVEDVTTSGKSTLEAVEVLRAAGATVEYACVVVDRESGAVKALADAKVQLDALANVSTLLDTPEARRSLPKAGVAGAGAKA